LSSLFAIIFLFIFVKFQILSAIFIAFVLNAFISTIFLIFMTFYNRKVMIKAECRISVQTASRSSTKSDTKIGSVRKIQFNENKHFVPIDYEHEEQNSIYFLQFQ
jgi:hypothetical protein